MQTSGDFPSYRAVRNGGSIVALHGRRLLHLRLAKNTDMILHNSILDLRGIKYILFNWRRVGIRFDNTREGAKMDLKGGFARW